MNGVGAHGDLAAHRVERGSPHPHHLITERAEHFILDGKGYRTTKQDA